LLKSTAQTILVVLLELQVTTLIASFPCLVRCRKSVFMGRESNGNGGFYSHLHVFKIKCGHGDKDSRDVPTLIAPLQSHVIVEISVFDDWVGGPRGHCLALSKQGRLSCKSK
jgi:hypothetical protein